MCWSRFFTDICFWVLLNSKIESQIADVPCAKLIFIALLYFWFITLHDCYFKCCPLKIGSQCMAVKKQQKYSYYYFTFPSWRKGVCKIPAKMNANQGTVSSDPVILATAGYDHTVRFWQAHSGICTRTVQHQDSVSFSHDCIHLYRIRLSNG